MRTHPALTLVAVTFSALAATAGGHAPQRQLQLASDTPPPLTVHGVSLAGMGIDRGDPSAPVTVVEFADFGCSACADFAAATFPSIEREFVATGDVRWRFVPFVLGPFPKAAEAARAALCAGDQGTFWPMHDRLFQQRTRWSRRGSPLPHFQGLAMQLGLDSAQFERCYHDATTKRRVDEATKAARRIGIRGTPTFFLNGRPVLGALRLPEFRELLDRYVGER